MPNANEIAQSIRDRIAAGGDLLLPGQWIAELTRVNREDGTRGAHVCIGYRDEFGQAHQTVALPVDMGDAGRGVQLVAAEAADAIAADAARESAETLAAERAATIEAQRVRIEELEQQQTTKPVAGDETVSKPIQGPPA